MDLKKIFKGTKTAYSKNCNVNRQNSLNYKDLEHAPKFQSNRRRNIGKYCDYYVKPLRNFLRNNVGHNWDIVYSKLCNLTKSSSKYGYRFREMIRWLVDIKPDPSRKLPNEFYVDSKNILRKSK